MSEHTGNKKCLLSLDPLQLLQQGDRDTKSKTEWETHAACPLSTEARPLMQKQTLVLLPLGICSDFDPPE